MNSGRSDSDTLLDDWPPLNAGSEPHPHPDRRVATIRWLAAVFIMATAAAALILGTLQTVLGSKIHLTRTPTLLRRVATGGIRRADRLASARPQGETVDIPVRIEQLDDGGLRSRPFTHVIAHLAHSLDVPLADTGQGREPIQQAQALPHEIQFGTSQQPNLPALANAYAPLDDGKPAPLAALSGIPVNVTVIAKTPANQATVRRVVVARADDTLLRILTALGTTAQDAQAITSLLAPRRWFSRNGFAGGETITVMADHSDDQSGPLHPQKVSIERQGKPDLAAVLSDAGRYVAVISPETGVDRAPSGDANDASILRRSSDQSLREGLDDMARVQHIDHALIDEIIRLSRHDVDLDAPILPNDKAELLYSANDLGQPD
jgi:hypothetical protein